MKPGERQFFIAGAFFVTPDKRYHMLVGNVDFPPEQERLMVPIDGGHPGWVYANRSKLILKNTDEHGAFRQYLKTSRMARRSSHRCSGKTNFSASSSWRRKPATRCATRTWPSSSPARGSPPGVWVAQGGPGLACRHLPASQRLLCRQGRRVAR
ncbi:MAG: hypothetical protein WDO24_03715 [Pseudomonadota bacterium]